MQPIEDKLQILDFVGVKLEKAVLYSTMLILLKSFRRSDVNSTNLFGVQNGK